MKRLLSMLLAALAVISVVSCSDAQSSNQTETTASSGEDTTEAESVAKEPELPDYDGEGGDFTFLIRMSNYAYDDKYVYAESQNGELINDSIYDRNAAVEEKFNIKIVGVTDEDPTSTAKKAITAGDDICDVMSDQKNQLAGMISNGSLYNLRKFEYSNFTASYWDANAYEQMSISGKLYFMPCDISMANFEGARFFYYNRTIADNYNLGDLYQYVYDNSWTLDRALALIASVSEDLNGDGVMSKEDRFGLLAEGGSCNGNVLYFITGGGIFETEEDENGAPQMNFMSDKLVTICDMCAEVLKDKNHCISYEDASKGSDTAGYAHIFSYCRAALFGTDHFLFVQSCFEDIPDFKDMESDYGILPTPKYESSQENYYHRIDRFSPMYAVPVTASDFSRIDIILEYMSWKSSETLVPNYFETHLKVKRTRDEDASAMIDIIKSSICYEIADIFDVGIAECIWDGYDKGDIASTYAKREAAIVKKLDKLAETYANGN